MGHDYRAKLLAGATRLLVCLLLLCVGASLSFGAEPIATDSESRPLPVVAPSRALEISVRGNHLVSEDGEVVTLHGVGVSTTMWSCLSGRAFEFPTNEASIESMVAWHINSVRIPLNEDCWLGINGAPRDIRAYRKAIRAYVERLNAHGLYVILDLHWNAPGTVLAHLGPGFAGYYAMADEDHSPAFWLSVASYFKSDHALLFDLFNEPKEISWSCWLNGCIAPRGYQTAGMQQLVDVVRATGATQPLMLGGLDGATVDGSEWLTNRPIDPLNQLVASVHLYSEWTVKHFNSNIGVVAERVPVVIGEVGEKNCASNHLGVILPWADAHGVSYSAWAWWVGKCSSPSLINNYQGTPTPFGIGYREHLLATFPATSPTGRHADS